MAARDANSILIWLTDGNGQLQEFKIEAGAPGLPSVCSTSLSSSKQSDCRLLFPSYPIPPRSPPHACPQADCAVIILPLRHGHPLPDLCKLILILLSISKPSSTWYLALLQSATHVSSLDHPQQALQAHPQAHHEEREEREGKRKMNEKFSRVRGNRDSPTWGG